MIQAMLTPVAAAAAALASPQAAIEAEMAASAAGWNAGSLERFMAVYADDAVYASGKELARGKAAIASRYAKSFADGANSRGRLAFQPVAWRTISNVHMLLVARWSLTPAAGEAQGGLTTLLFERRKEGWRIIADHSS
ncbi:SgcJ/EcaC family oxidoreductase [Sphingomonas sp. IC-11]|uniref:YybH family protein n=1 Tax=Sphingomonas sp. IC-11 TaxID=2898528 RepID=UPI001E3FF232|nr:SgcJ/EcaC family oxidoreductase [Sphingomonas sp. IC-11]MCD2315208.1 SgcJ/EcaC family oxidoreductase [Sphingomonas sp. IC-11]